MMCLDHGILTATLCYCQHDSPHHCCPQTLVKNRLFDPRIVDERPAVFRPSNRSRDDHVSFAQEAGDWPAIAVRGFAAAECEYIIAELKT